MARAPNPRALDRIASWISQTMVMDGFRSTLNAIRSHQVQIEVLQQTLDHEISFRHPRFDPVLYSAANIRQKLDVLHQIRVALHDLDTVIERARHNFEDNALELASIFRSAINTDQELPHSWTLVEGLQFVLDDCEEVTMAFRGLLDELYVWLLVRAVSFFEDSGEGGEIVEEMDTEE